MIGIYLIQNAKAATVNFPTHLQKDLELFKFQDLSISPGKEVIISRITEINFQAKKISETEFLHIWYGIDIAILDLLETVAKMKLNGVT